MSKCREEFEKWCINHCKYSLSYMDCTKNVSTITDSGRLESLANCVGDV